MPRFPFPSTPTGWFQVAWSRELPAEGVVPLHYFEKELVLWRDEKGVAHLLDAYCPHLGAHLGYGGCVEDGAIRCPFHGWRIGAGGACVSIPYAEKVPPKAVIKAWPVREQDGLILAWSGDGAPAWDPPAIAELHADGWTSTFREARFSIKTHVQEMAENVVDGAHFREVHRLPTWPDTRVETHGNVLRAVHVARQRTPRGDVDTRIEAALHGLGLFLVRFVGISDTLFLTAPVPVDGERVDVRVSFLSRAGAGAVADALVDDIITQFDHDIPIWEHKLHRVSPNLCAADGPVATFRQWARQFHVPGNMAG